MVEYAALINQLSGIIMIYFFFHLFIHFDVYSYKITVYRISGFSCKINFFSRGGGGVFSTITHSTYMIQFMRWIQNETFFSIYL